LTVLDQNFRTPKIADIRKNIGLIAEKCKFLRDRTLEKSLAAAYYSHDFKSTKKNLDDASNELLKSINFLCERFLKNNKSVLLIDDVANSGSTMLYAMKPLLEFHPSQIETVILVERTHKKFPVAVNYVGLSVATTQQENIIVEVESGLVTKAYIVNSSH
jgi:pyrimidine operon attenuation protein/uracil phosphoribosyltransferase